MIRPVTRNEYFKARHQVAWELSVHALQKLVNSKDPSLVFFMDMILKQGDGEGIRNSIGFASCFEVLRVKMGEGLLFLWKTYVTSNLSHRVILILLCI